MRRDGYATAIAELEDELVAVAAPVFDPAGTCVAALSISGPEFRMLASDPRCPGPLVASADPFPAEPQGTRALST